MNLLTAVPGSRRHFILWRTIPAKEVLRHMSSRVFGSYETVQLVTVDIGRLWAGAGFQVVGNTGRRGVGFPAKRAGHILTTMSAGIEVLANVVAVLERAVTRPAVVVMIDLMLFALLFAGVRLITLRTFVGEVVSVPHVLLSCMLGIEVPRASIALVRWTGMAG